MTNILLESKSLLVKFAETMPEAFPFRVEEQKLHALVDHTLLKPDVQPDAVRKLCEEANEYEFAAVCVNPSFVELCATLLKGTKVKTCSVLGFPLGTTTLGAKMKEAEECLRAGALELDMVLHVGHLKAGNNQYLLDEISSLARYIHSEGAILKVILETCLLTDEEKIRACLLCMEAQADFVKTSTGFSTGGATLQDIRLMRFVVGDALGVKASGGIKSRKDAVSMIKAGATRIGTSSGIAIAGGLQTNSPSQY